MNTQASIKHVIETIKSAGDIPEPQKDTLVSKLEAIPTPLQTDEWIYRLVVVFLGVAILATVIGGMVLAFNQTGDQEAKIPQGLIAIGSAAVGALAGLLAPSPRQG